MKKLTKIQECECETPHSYRNRTSCPGYQAAKTAISLKKKQERIARGNKAKIVKKKKTLAHKKTVDQREWGRKCKRLLFLQSRVRMLVLGYRDTSAPTTKEQTLAAFYAYTNVYEQECEMAGVVPTTSTVALTSHFIDYLVYVFGVHVFKKKNGLPTLPPLGPKIKAGQVPPPKRVRFCDTPVIIPQRERILPEVPLFSEAAPVPVPVPAPIPTPVREVHLGVPFNRWKNSAPRAVTRQERLSALVPAAAPVPAPRPRVQEEEKKNERPPQTFEERVEASKDLYTLLLDSGIRNAIENGQNPNNPFSGTREIAYDKAMEDFMQCGLSYDVAKEVIRRQAEAARRRNIHQDAWYAQQHAEKVRIVMSVAAIVVQFCGGNGDAPVNFDILRKAVAQSKLVNKSDITPEILTSVLLMLPKLQPTVFSIPESVFVIRIIGRFDYEALKAAANAGDLSGIIWK